MATTVAMAGALTFRERYDQLKTVEQRKDDLIEVCDFVGCFLLVGHYGLWLRGCGNTVDVGTCARG